MSGSGHSALLYPEQDTLYMMYKRAYIIYTFLCIVWSSFFIYNIGKGIYILYKTIIADPEQGSVGEGDRSMAKTKKKLFCVMVLVMTFLHYYGPLMICAG